MTGPVYACLVAPAPVGSPGHLADEGFENLPLVIREVHGCCILLLDAAYHTDFVSVVVVRWPAKALEFSAEAARMTTSHR